MQSRPQEKLHSIKGHIIDWSLRFVGAWAWWTLRKKYQDGVRISPESQICTSGKGHFLKTITSCFLQNVNNFKIKSHIIIDMWQPSELTNWAIRMTNWYRSWSFWTIFLLHLKKITIWNLKDRFKRFLLFGERTKCGLFV